MGNISLTPIQKKKNIILTFEFWFNIMLRLIFYFWICFNAITFSLCDRGYKTSLNQKTLLFCSIGILLILVKSMDKKNSNDYLIFLNFFYVWFELQCKWAFFSTILNCGVPLDIKDRGFYGLPSIGCKTPFYFPL